MPYTMITIASFVAGLAAPVSARLAAPPGLAAPVSTRLAAPVTMSAAASTVPIIDVGPLLEGGDTLAHNEAVAQIHKACTEVGFFYVKNHGVSELLQQRLESTFAHFVSQPREVKRRIEMAKAGTSWRGYFEVGEELTKGLPDQKEGIYFAAESPEDTRPLHGANLFPDEADAPGLRGAVLEYMSALKSLSRTLLVAIGDGLSLPADVFRAQFEEPTTLFRCFHYPPHDPKWGDDSMAVGEHTDMGFLTVLKQDDSGGLQVRGGGETETCWVDVPPVPGTFVVNLGDCLERSTGGLLRATTHRVQQRRGATAGRFSYPFFFDPSFEAEMRSYEAMMPVELRERAAARRERAPQRWDGRSMEAIEGPYRDFIISKVSMVFPELAAKSGVRTET
jgi:isopenicillin N synthase-like dioxygenase